MDVEAKRVWRGPVAWSLVLHLLVAVPLLISLERDRPLEVAVDDEPGEVIQARAVDAAELDAARETLAERERQREAAARQARQEAERRAREQEQARQAAEAQRQREAEEAERRRQAEQARQRAEEERRRQEAEEQRRREAEEARRRAEEEERRRAEEEAERRRQEEAERQRRAEEERRQREAEEAMQRAAEEEARQRAEAERQRRLASLEARYAQEIRAHVERHWIRPSDVPDDLSCVVVARQIPGGEVVDVRVRDCNAPASVVRSIETAVYRASPLPPPPEEEIFRQTIQFTFRGDAR
ncbi:cell envelope integrity protein TolA [Natronospira bacteriovora]|uniref:Cell envelope integrity protein TolA n=1 Tax=Natronospira bacteriovora TaxID=3069753 RepID=A0ABU0W3B9_9GAMM|nr:cell envelope integrity protein TolA [Natronospira sp. AB-CW4]MDQ2068508.1 cell envelope integrity protein TolA [Natronospira sp. AB-CW4]